MQLHKRLIASGAAAPQRFWFCLSLGFAIAYGLLALRQAFSAEFVIQDDARQHVFWMQRYGDASLFPNDLIANYFQSVAPAGYAALYKLLAWVGIEPVLASKLLPIVLGVITTGYCFGVAIELLPVPVVGFVASLLLNQNLWMKEDLVSATPRAFVYPIFLAFLYYFLRRSRLCWVMLLLQALFYPGYVLVADGLLVLQLGRWQAGRLQPSHDRPDFSFCLIGLGVSLVGLLPFALSSSEFGPAIAVAEAQNLPEFQTTGLIGFFKANPIDYWFTGKRSGLLPRSLFTPATVVPGLLLPGLLLLPDRFPLVTQLRRGIVMLPQLLLAASAVFLLAHAVLFKLHLPNRYTGVSFRLVITLAAAIALVVILDAVYVWARGVRSRMGWAIGSTLILGAALVLYPAFGKQFPVNSYVVGQHPDLYRFLQQQPKDGLIASLSGEANNLPSFARRSVLVAQEYGVPYQIGYYRLFRQRLLDLIQAQYSPDPQTVVAFLRNYPITLWLLDKSAFEVGYLRQRWLTQFQPATQGAIVTLQQQQPVLSQLLSRCQVWQSEQFTLLQATCIQQTLTDRSVRKVPSSSRTDGFNRRT